MRIFSILLTAATAIALFGSPASAQLGSGNPSDTDLPNQRKVEKPSASGLGIFDVAVPSAGTKLQPVKRVPRDKYGVVGPLPLSLNDLDALVYPGTTLNEKKALLEGLTFFTKVHTPGELPLTSPSSVAADAASPAFIRDENNEYCVDELLTSRS